MINTADGDSSFTGRTLRVQMMLGRLRSDDIEPSEYEAHLIQSYIDSKISLNDLVAHSRQFSTESQFHDWMRERIFFKGNDTQFMYSNDEFIFEIEASIRRNHLRHEGDVS